MSQNLDRIAELEKLLSALADDQLDMAGRTRIGELLDGDPEACEFYLDYMSLNAHLEQELGSVEPVQFLEKLPEAQIEEATTIYLATRQPPPPPVWRQPWALAAAAVVIAGVWIISLMTAPEKIRVAQEDASNATDNAVAVLTDAVDAQFAAGSLQPERGDLLPKGMLKLEQGIARLQFYSGAEVILEGPIEFELLSDNSAACPSGTFRATIPRPAQGFSVASTLVDIVDLGTQFGATITPDRGAEIHVFEGEVEVYEAGTNRDPDKRHLLTAGYGLEVGTDGTYIDMLADSTAFISEDEVEERMRLKAAARHSAWQDFISESISRDPRVMVHYPFISEDTKSRMLEDRAEIGGLRNGIIIGSSWVSGRWPGKRGLSFSRPSDRVRIDMKGAPKSLSLIAWVKLDSLDQRFSSLLVTDRLSRGVEWQITRAGALQFGVRKAKQSSDQYISPVALTKHIGKWTQVAVTLDAETRKVCHYVNGELLSTQPLKSPAVPVIGKAQIGNWNAPREGDSYPVRNLHGRIDEFLIYREALKSDELRDLFEIGLP